MIRSAVLSSDVAPLKRRQLLRLMTLGALSLAGVELAAAVAPFLRVNKPPAVGKPVVVGTKAEILAQFAATNDRPILFQQGRFFLMHAPGGIAAAYRKCTHLGCIVPFAAAEDRFHCVCHQSIYDKRTAVVISGPAPRPLDLFAITTSESGELVVDTNPLRVIVRQDNRWDPAHLHIPE